MSIRFLRQTAVPLVLVAVALFSGLPVRAQPDPSRHAPELIQAQRYLDQGGPALALEILDGVVKQGQSSAEALLLRSTALTLAGDHAAGFRDLERALELDPTLRQGWLNLAGFEIAEGRYGEAYKALLKARDLDPSASDNDLNLGAVLILQGESDRARGHFDRYLASQGGSAEAQYLVACNFALAGHEALAVELDERYRLKARSDGRFVGISSPDYSVLLNADTYTLPPGSLTSAAAFRVPYRQTDNRLLSAVLEALQEAGEPYDSDIEANADWALIWGAMRIKVSNQSDGTGVVSLSAPQQSFTPEEWRRRSQALFQIIYRKLGG